MIGILIEGLVCVLLAATILHCVRLDRKLKMLKADEQTMRRTIVDLVSATEKAERAVAGLRSLVSECDATITGQLREAERYATDLQDQIRTGDDVISRIAQIVETARRSDAMAAPAPVRAAPAAAPPAALAPAARPAPQQALVDLVAAAEAAKTPHERLVATLAAAQAFAERARRRVDGKAA
jgi:hypothetical protein